MYTIIKRCKTNIYSIEIEFYKLKCYKIFYHLKTSFKTEVGLIYSYMTQKIKLDISKNFKNHIANSI